MKDTMGQLRTIILLLAATTLAQTDRAKLQPVVIPGQIGHPVSSQVNARSKVIVEYWISAKNGGRGVRVEDALQVHSESNNAEAEHPLFVVVKQQKDIYSWRIPWRQQPGAPYYRTVTRTICHRPEEEYLLLISVSTSSPTNVNFKVGLDVPKDFDLKLGQEYQKSLTPSAPLFFRFRFQQPGTVLLNVTSDDSSCMVVSVQNYPCPVYDLYKRPVAFLGGLYQTTDKVAGITLTAEGFRDGAYIVMVINPEDKRCGNEIGVDSFFAPEPTSRQKKVTFSIERRISEKEYLSVVGWTLFVILVSYFLVSAVHWGSLIHRRNDTINSPQEVELLESTANDGKGVDDVEDVEDVQGVEDVKDVEDVRGVEDVKDVEDVRGVEDVEDVEDKEDATESVPSDTGDALFKRCSMDEQDFYRLLSPETDGDINAKLYVSDLILHSPEDKKHFICRNVLIVTLLYGLPVVQLVLTSITLATGDLDRCYYNFRCANPLGIFQDFNHLFSNIGYCLLGLGFYIIVLLSERCPQSKERAATTGRQHLGLPQHRGIDKALGLALIVEGLMSTCYHVCPNRTNFQFDTAFMYVISCLVLLKMYQARRQDIFAEASKIFLALAILIFTASIGMLPLNYFSWMPLFIIVVFGIIQVIIYYVLSTQIYYVGRCSLHARLWQLAWVIPMRALCAKCVCSWSLLCLLAANAVNAGGVFYIARQVSIDEWDVATALLGFFIINVFSYTAYYYYNKHRLERVKWQPLCYSAVAIVVWGWALWYFLFQQSTTWKYLPARARHNNRRCLFFDFYDRHDAWHLLSALGLFLHLMFLFTLDDDLRQAPRDKINVF